MFSICLRAFLPCRGGCSAFCYSPTRPPSCSKRFLKWLSVRGTPIMMRFKKKSSCCLAKFCASECNGVFQVILEIQCEALEAMLIKNDLSEVRAYKVKHVAGHVHVGGFLPSCVCAFPVGQCERDRLSSPPSFTIWFCAAFDRGVNHCALGPLLLRQQLGEGRWTCWCPSVRVCVCVCLSFPPISPLYLLYPRGWNVHELGVSSFSGKTAGRASLAPFHVFPGSGLGSQLPAGHSVLKCLLL